MEIEEEIISDDIKPLSYRSCIASRWFTCPQPTPYHSAEGKSTVGSSAVNLSCMVIFCDDGGHDDDDDDLYHCWLNCPLDLRGLEATLMLINIIPLRMMDECMHQGSKQAP